MEQDTYSVRASIVLENIKNVAIYMIQPNFA